MGENKEAHADFPADVPEDIEIEFIDEDSGADTPPDKADTSPDKADALTRLDGKFGVAQYDQLAKFQPDFLESQ